MQVCFIFTSEKLPYYLPGLVGRRRVLFRRTLWASFPWTIQPLFYSKDGRVSETPYMSYNHFVYTFSLIGAFRGIY